MLWRSCEIMSIVKDMKQVYPDLMSQIDKFKQVPTSGYLRLPDIQGNQTSKERLEFLRRMFTFVFTSGIIQNVTIKYIQSPGTLGDVVEDIEQDYYEEDCRQMQYYRGKMQYDNKKLRTYFRDQDMVERVQRFEPYNTRKPYDLDIYKKELDTAIQDFKTNDSLIDNCIIDLQSDSVRGSVQDKEFDTFLKLLRPYSKRAVDNVNNSIPDKLKGYIQYLCNGNKGSLSDIDNKRYNMLKSLLLDDEIPKECDFNILLREDQDNDEQNLDFEIDMSTYKGL